MFVLITGVTGCGKTTIGTLLAAELHWPFYDADDFHSASNVRKMASGIALNDEDRGPWLQTLHQLIVECSGRGDNGVLACSALKQSYRNVLCADADVALVYLKADPALIQSRLAQRQGHYMSPQLIDSQFRDLEEPVGAIVVDASISPDHIITVIRDHLGK